MDIQYSELSAASEQTGVINFRNVHSLFTNITNIDSMVARNNHLEVNLDAVFMRSGKLTARFDFMLNDKNNRFTASGQLKNMNGKDLNVATKPLAKLEIRSCNIQEMTFHIKGDVYKATGNVQLLYQRLRIALLKQEKGQKEFTRKGLVSMIANTLVIKESNPLKGEKVRVANVVYTRDSRKSFFNLVWKTLFTGAKDITGAGNN
jgi:hypothetical protein